MSATEPVSVHILDREYTVGVAPDERSSLMAAAKLLDSRMREVRGSNRMAQAPMSMMRFEHDQHGDALATLVALTHDITPPADACNTWRALYAGLNVLREDLMQHIHLENNVLFLNAEQAATAVR